MIDLFGRVMLYVKDPEAEAAFWVEKAGFVQLDRQPLPNGSVFYELAPAAGDGTRLVLFDREMVARAEPELNLGAPSILFSSYDLRRTYREFSERGIAVGQLVDMGDMRSFNFSDPEGNWFAVREVPAPPQ